jgi:hypothetical protein
MGRWLPGACEQGGGQPANRVGLEQRMGQQKMGHALPGGTAGKRRLILRRRTHDVNTFVYPLRRVPLPRVAPGLLATPSFFSITAAVPGTGRLSPHPLSAAE